MIDELYYYGVLPSDVNKLTISEMASFIKQRRKQEVDTAETNASIAYAAGLIASMSMSNKRPRYDQVFKFPKEEKPITEQDVEQSRARMLAWAETINRNARRSSQHGRKANS